MNKHDLVQKVRDALASRQCRLVLAESCTAGNVAGALAIVPGISQWLCGSFVVYRNESKAQWLSIPRPLLDDPQIGPVSAEVTQLLARQALQATPEADVAAAVTGHIGPGCPSELDGRVFFSFTTRQAEPSRVLSHSLVSPAPQDAQDLDRRQARLDETTQWVLQSLLSALSSAAGR